MVSVPFFVYTMSQVQIVLAQESVFGKITKKSNTNLAVVTRLTFDVYGYL